MTDQLTKTETRRRLVAAAAAVRAIDPDVSTGMRIEAHTRAIPVAATTEAEAREIMWPEGDDLWDFCQWNLAPSEEQFRVPGAIVHLAFSTTGDWGELVDTRVVWLGFGDADPVVLDTRRSDRNTIDNDRRRQHVLDTLGR